MNLRHGNARRGAVSTEYRSWRAMIDRCYYPKTSGYRTHGAKGIRVCPRWQNSFEAFAADMGPKPSTAHTLERRDSNAGYSPENCRWATRAEQLRNTSRTRRVLVNGVAMCLKDACAQVGITYDSAMHRIVRLGWSPAFALMWPTGRTRWGA